MLQENHYYPFGLTMSGPWMDDAAASDNKFLFNDMELCLDFGLNWYFTDFRTLDPTIGIWTQTDPLSDCAPDLTPYRFGFNNPISFVDPLGLFETKKEAKKYRKEHDISSKDTKIVKVNGKYEIRYEKSSGYIVKLDNGNIEVGAVAHAKNAIREKEPSYKEKLRDGELLGKLGQLIYNFTDPLYVALQDFNPLDTDLRHLDNTGVGASERQEALANAALTALPYAKAKIVMPIGLRLLPSLNYTQVNKLVQGGLLNRTSASMKEGILKLYNFTSEKINKFVETGNLAPATLKLTGESNTKTQ